MKKNKLKELAKYSKEEIIEALGRVYMSDSVIDSLHAQLEYNRRTKAIEEHKKSIDAERSAFADYIDWKRRMITKYGDGERVFSNQVPTEELQRGAKLEAAWYSARKKEKALDAKVTRLLALEATT